MARPASLRGTPRPPGSDLRTVLRIVPAVAAAVLGLGLATAWAATVTVSQKDRVFQPGTVTINRGDTLRILNDDGELLHHAYVRTPQFSFDSGEQEPGSKTDVVFPVAGTFTVLCAIHPKMRMVVTVK